MKQERLNSNSTPLSIYLYALTITLLQVIYYYNYYFHLYIISHCAWKLAFSHSAHATPRHHFTWVKILTNKDQAISIAICYFPPKGSWYNMAGETSLVHEGPPHGPSPYEPLLDDIIRYSSQGEVFLVGDFKSEPNPNNAQYLRRIKT